MVETHSRIRYGNAPMEKSLAHQPRAGLSPLAVAVITLLTLLWGFNYVAIKVSNESISPVFASAIRSVIASICGVIYCMRTGQKLFHRDVMLIHGLVVGVLFGLEFACIYFGLLYTDAARSVVFVYLAPFIVAVGAHFFLKGDRLTLLKGFGLILAFGGVLAVFQGKPKGSGSNMLFGDVLQITAAFLWAATTLYIKKFMAAKIHPINTFLYQLVFSIPILFVVSLILEPQWIASFTLKASVSLFYQSVIVAFASYFVWFKLIHDFPVSRLSSFTFFTPVFGVLFGVLIMGEELTLSLMVGLPLVCAGIFFVNWKKENG
ncbi:MAG: DMT family transporter [Desulfobacteraceae bacterium]|nr:MAG: DMT family transporter [Desulfobacteraceae bacterium]